MESTISQLQRVSQGSSQGWRRIRQCTLQSIIVQAEVVVVCVSGRQRPGRGTLVDGQHTRGGGRSARTVRERVPSEMQSGSEAAADNCNINRIGSPWRVRMFHRSWFQVTLVLTCRTTREIEDSASSRAPPASMSESNGAHESVRRHGRLQQRGGEVGDC